MITIEESIWGHYALCLHIRVLGPATRCSRQSEEQKYTAMTCLQDAFLASAESHCADDGDRFFQSPEFCYLKSLEDGNFYLCIEQGVLMLNYCYKIDKNAYNEIHKGFPYFWIGVAALIVHDYEKALGFIDSAIIEDQRNINATRRPLATAFCTLEKKGINLYVDRLIDSATNLINGIIDKYNYIYGCQHNPIDLEEFKRFFLVPAFSKPENGLRSIATTFITFMLEWEDRKTIRSLLPTNATSETFFLHLFKGTLLFESLLKAALPKCFKKKNNGYVLLSCEDATLGQIINSKIFENDTYKPFCTEILDLEYQPIIGGKTLQNILEELQNSAPSVTTCVETAGRIRNTTGHFLGWIVDLNRDKYDALVEMIGVACLHAIACLYRTPKRAVSC